MLFNFVFFYILVHDYDFFILLVTLREDPSRINVILQQKLMEAKLSAVHGLYCI